MKVANKIRIIALIGLCAIAICFAIFWRTEGPLNAEICIGQTEGSIIARLGPPSARWKGEFGLRPLAMDAARHNIESMCWKRQTGTLYISVSDESGTSTCFDADWLPRGAVY